MKDYEAEKSAGRAKLEPGQESDRVYVCRKAFNSRTGEDLGFQIAERLTLEEIDYRIEHYTEELAGLQALKVDAEAVQAAREA